MRSNVCLSFLFSLTVFTLAQSEIDQKNSHDYFIDVVIPCHEKDKRTLDLSIDSLRQYAKNVRRIITVSQRPLTEKAEWFDEARYPFTKYDLINTIFNGDQDKVHAFINTPTTRAGWIYQQFLKLYAAFVIPDIAENVLIVDADVILLKNISFIDDEGYALYARSIDFHMPYFSHAQRLLPGFVKVFGDSSGICHHMLMQRHVLQDLFNVIQKNHPNQEPWQAFCHCVDTNEMFSCLSEYEIYFNFSFSRNYKVKIRDLRCFNFENKIFDKNIVTQAQNEGFDYIAYHIWLS